MMSLRGRFFLFRITVFKTKKKNPKKVEEYSTAVEKTKAQPSGVCM